MAIVKKSAARKPVSRKAKGPSPQQQQAMQQAMQQQQAAAQQQQGPPQQGGQPMMKKGGKITKKYEDGGPIPNSSKNPKATKKPASVSERIGNLTLRDVKNSTEDALNIATLGGYKSAKKGIKDLTGLKSGGSINKAKCGTKMKKAQSGTKLGKALPPPAKCGAKMKK